MLLVCLHVYRSNKLKAHKLFENSDANSPAFFFKEANLSSINESLFRTGPIPSRSGLYFSYAFEYNVITLYTCRWRNSS